MTLKRFFINVTHATYNSTYCQDEKLRPGLDRDVPVNYFQDMPAKNRLKQYIHESYYHIYNRGTEKRLIFLDTQDYSVFISYLQEYLRPRDEAFLIQKLPQVSPEEKEQILRALSRNNFHNEITLIAYCLMPNHFHFFIKQKDAQSVDKFMNSIATRYTMYFNKKYNRVGSLYQGVYKAVLIKTEQQFIHLSRYIHRQAFPNQPSSLSSYLGKSPDWIHPEEVLSYFSKINPNLSYKSFIKQEDNRDIIQDISLED